MFSLFPRIALVWHYPIDVQKRKDDGLMAMMRMLTMSQGPDFSPKQEPVYEQMQFVHWKPCRSPDDLPSDISVQDIKVSSLRTRPIEREVIILNDHNIILNREGHVWLATNVDKRTRHMRGLVAGIVRRRSVADRWVATGSMAGISPMDVPAEVSP
jgi:hypothetical protein